MDEQALGKRLQLARKRAGLTQQELCQKAGLSYSTLAKIERGAIRSPSVFTVASIATATGSPLEDLLELSQAGASPALSEAKKRSKSGVRFVYFDVNGVLVRFFHRAFNEIAKATDKSEDVIETLFWRYNDEVCGGQLSLEDFNGIMARELGINAFDWQKYYMNSVEAVPGVKELVEWAAEYYEVGLFSNSMPGFIEELMQRGLIPKVNYKVIVDSSKISALKAQPKMYQVGQELAAVQAQEILLIDDSRPNLTHADKLGWHVLWFDDFRPAESIDKAKKSLEF